jgi:outer membrane protein OmpA-like peptidoglycan-associated protein
MLSSRSALILADPRTLANPARAIDRLARAGLNFKCRGWRVTMVDGSSTPRGTSLSPTEDSGLRRFWALYFRHCGGALVSYSTQLVAFPVSGPAITGADYSTIPTSTIQVHVARRRHTIVATLTGNVLFTTNSAALRPGARAALAKLLTLIAAARGRITVVGYTDSRGGATINGPLSRARARSVARWIVMRAHVRPGRLTVHGLGARDPVATNATAVGRARNRRVVVTIHVG